MKKLLTLLLVCLVASAVCAELTNDNTTIAIWRMDTIVSGSPPYIADDDYGTQSFTARNAQLRLGGSTTNEAREPSLVSDSRPGGSGYCLQYDGDSVKDWSVALSVWNGEDFAFDSVKVEMWLKPLSLPASGQHTVMGAQVWELRISNTGRAQFMTRDAADGARWAQSADNTLVVNKWHHIIMEFVDGVQKITVASEDNLDSPQTWTTTGLTPMKLQDNGLYVGGGATINTLHAHMRLDEVRISVPTMPGVDDNWQSPRQDDMNTFALLHFDELVDPNFSSDPESIFTPDDNSFNPRRRAFDSKFLGFNNVSASMVDSISPEFGKCIKFDGYEERILITYRDMYDYVTREDFRVEAWVKLSNDAPDIESGQEFPIFSQQWSFRSYYQYEDAQWKVSGVFGYDRDGTLVGSTIRAPITNPKQWNHIAIQWNKGQMSLYINGELKDRRFDRNAATSLRVSSDRLAVGSQGSTGSSTKFNGFIDEVRIVNIYPQQAPCNGGASGYPAGDINRDCSVDIIDFATLADQWLNFIDRSSAYDWTTLDADLSFDAEVGEDDLTIFIENWLSN